MHPGQVDEDDSSQHRGWADTLDLQFYYCLRNNIETEDADERVASLELFPVLSDALYDMGHIFISDLSLSWVGVDPYLADRSAVWGWCWIYSLLSTSIALSFYIIIMNNLSFK